MDVEKVKMERKNKGSVVRLLTYKEAAMEKIKNFELTMVRGNHTCENSKLTYMQMTLNENNKL